MQAWQLQRQGALLQAAMVALGGGVFGWGLWQLRRILPASQRLRLFPDGLAHFVAGDTAQEVWLAPCSLRLGDHVLLVLRSAGRRPVRLLLGPGNLSAEDRAALGRWLQRAPGGQGTQVGVLR